MDQAPFPSKPSTAISPPRWVHDKWCPTPSPSLPHPPSPFRGDQESSRSASLPPGSAQNREPWATEPTQWGIRHVRGKGDSQRPWYGDEFQGESEGRGEGREAGKGSKAVQAHWDGTVVKSWERRDEVGAGLRGWSGDGSGAVVEVGAEDGRAQSANPFNFSPSSFSSPFSKEQVYHVRIPSQPDLEAWFSSQRISALDLDSDGLPTRDINLFLPAGLHPGQTLVLSSRPLLPGHTPDPRAWPNELYTERYVIPYPPQWATDAQRRADRPGFKSWEGGERRRAMCPDERGRWRRWVRTVGKDEGLEVRWKNKPVREIGRRWGRGAGGASAGAAPADSREWAGPGQQADGGWARALALQRSVSSLQTGSSTAPSSRTWGTNPAVDEKGRKRAWTESLSGNTEPGGWGVSDERAYKSARMEEPPSGSYDDPMRRLRTTSPPHLPGGPAAWRSRTSLDRASPPHLPRYADLRLSRASSLPMNPHRPRAVSQPTSPSSYPTHSNVSDLEDEISKKHDEIEHIHAVLRRCGDMEARLRGALEKSEGEMRTLREQAGGAEDQ